MTIDRFTEILEENDMSFGVTERNGDVLIGEIEFYSRLGEEVVETLYFNQETIADDFNRLAMEFDPDEHAAMWIKGREEISASIRDLIDDADWIKGKLEHVAESVMLAEKLEEKEKKEMEEKKITENNFMKLMTIASETGDRLAELTEIDFLCISCMLFDMYHDRHKESNAVEMARTVYEQVKLVNANLGEFNT